MGLTIDVTSDVICPWCYIGKRRLERAIAEAGLKNVAVRWHPFQLNPEMPKEGIDRQQYRTAKFGSWEKSLERDAVVAAAGRDDGIHFAFDKTQRTPNTQDAHRLIWLAGENDLQDAVVEAFFRAYFVKGKDFCRQSTLLDVASVAGLDRGLAEQTLRSDHGLAELHEDEERSRKAGVRGVPFFVINQMLPISGAVDPATFVKALHYAGLAAE